jgi:hypothetical protein
MVVGIVLGLRRCCIKQRVLYGNGSWSMVAVQQRPGNVRRAPEGALENKTWREALVYIQAEFEQFGRDHRRYGARLIRLCSYPTLPDKGHAKGVSTHPSLHGRPARTAGRKPC